MSRSTHFIQRCPTCGRTLEVRSELLGSEVVCQHCGARFVAQSDLAVTQSRVDRVEALLQQADELLNPSELAE